MSAEFGGGRSVRTPLDWDRMLPLVGVAGVVALWQIAVSTRMVQSALLPPPLATAKRFCWMFTEGRIMIDLSESMLRMALGYFPAAIVGVVFGLVFGTFRWIGRSAGFLLDFIRSTPITAAYPLFIVFLGLGDVAKAAMICAATCPAVILATAYGVKNAGTTRTDMARLFGANRWQIFWQVRFFDAMPHIVVGLRVGLSYALIVSIVVELFLGTQHGLGQRVFEAYQASQMPDLFALICLIGTIGYLFNLAFVCIESRVFHWTTQ